MASVLGQKRVVAKALQAGSIDLAKKSIEPERGLAVAEQAFGLDTQHEGKPHMLNELMGGAVFEEAPATGVTRALPYIN